MSSCLIEDFVGKPRHHMNTVQTRCFKPEHHPKWYREKSTWEMSYSLIKSWFPAKISFFPPPNESKNCKFSGNHWGVSIQIWNYPCFPLNERSSVMPGAWHIYCLPSDFLNIFIFLCISFFFCYSVMYESY